VTLKVVVAPVLIDFIVTLSVIGMKLPREKLVTFSAVSRKPMRSVFVSLKFKHRKIIQASPALFQPVDYWIHLPWVCHNTILRQT
jgi:hypothetical protein